MNSNELPDFREMRALRDEFARFLLSYKFGSDEMLTKINILKEAFELTHDYSPIEHVSFRLKSADSIFEKARRRGIELSLVSIRKNILDIAGIRITCSFISDAYRLRDMLVRQEDVTVLETKDYIRNPKSNGYKSLHILLSVPVFTLDRVDQVPVELQIRTIAMDFWASLEHKIYYKYEGAVPERLIAELKDAADVADRLDRKMERLHEEVTDLQRTEKAHERRSNPQLSEELLEDFARAMRNPEPRP
ncbi:GTP pyrophosphokinase family protein [Arthrobacter sp. B1805]|uniref:GTP pyrophosphokinase n=1 Tax=Arthrobacter sp. B1805 TaxID=2058892 RepID=UPI000CE4115F|nr:GTP pyrophosphokinase family protein [Arthrobacter sp. B1805]